MISYNLVLLLISAMNPSEQIIALLAITISTFFIMNLIVPPVRGRAGAGWGAAGRLAPDLLALEVVEMDRTMEVYTEAACHG